MTQRSSPSAGFVRFIRLLAGCLWRNDIASLAAVIAFYALFSVFPMLLLLLYAASWLVPRWQSHPLLLSLLHSYFPTLPDEIVRNWDTLLAAGGKLGVLSAISLLWSAGSAFIAMQQALDTLWSVSTPRSYASRRLLAFMMLLILLALTVLSGLGMALVVPLRAASWLPGWIRVLHGVSRLLFPISIFLGLLVFYRFLPSRTMAWRHLIPAALMATAALDAGRAVFVWYAAHLVTYQLVYGSLAAVMLFVLWVYIGSILMLFGAAVAWSLEQWWEADAE
ncbi:MAG: YihY/virulence factor BrkB family protein [Thermoflavifilum sp.]|nr:YihY/virulence factor BrkB family protein [Thermoflavifilum sp.]MCL6513894.1 YihY/virulence factor BrkB family protein [Alicyclobacillus sp.]